MSDLRIEGANKLGILAKALRNVGDKELQKELYAGLNRATKELRADVKDSQVQNLPDHGGLNKELTRGKGSVRRRGGKNPSVRIVFKGIEQMDRIDRQGRVRHPVFRRAGRRTVWVDQRIPKAKGWFTDPLENGAPAVRKELVRVIDEVAKKLARKI